MKNGKLEVQIAKLSQQIEVEQARYKAAVAVAVKDVLAHYGIALDALDELVTPAKPVTKATTKPAKKAAKKVVRKQADKRVRGPQPAKYRDPVSGATWSGFARPPAWIAEAKDRTKFLINGAADA